MTVGIKLLRLLQFGRETTAGNAVAASTKWRGMGTIQDAREITEVEEDIGLLSGANRIYTGKLGGTLSLASTPATFEQLLHIFEMGIKAATPAQDGSGSGYVYSYDLPVTATNTIKTYTIEGGDNVQAEEVEFCFCTGFTIESDASAGGAVMVSAEVTGRQVTKTTFTGAVALPAVKEILASKGKLYLDAVGGTIGTTQVSDTLLSCSINVDTGWRTVTTHDGELYFTIIKNVGPKVEVSLTFEHNASAVAQKDLWVAETPRLLRLQWDGPALTTPDTYSNKILRVDLAGTWRTFDAISDSDGNDVITGGFKAGYDSTAALYALFLLVNELSAIP